MMKKIFAFCLTAMLAACSSESTVSEGVSAYDVQGSDCKTSLSKADTRSGYYTENAALPTTLRLTLGTDGVTRGSFSDLQDNCVVGQLLVSAVCKGNQIVLVIYPEIDSMTDCVCLYDVDFKISSLLAGDYHLTVYHGRANLKFDKSAPVFDGPIRLDTGKSIELTLKRR